MKVSDRLFDYSCWEFGFIPGHSIPVRGDWPNTMRQFIVQACQLQSTSGEEAHFLTEHQVEGDFV